MYTFPDDPHVVEAGKHAALSHDGCIPSSVRWLHIGTVFWDSDTTVSEVAIRSFTLFGQHASKFLGTELIGYCYFCVENFSSTPGC